LSPPTPFKIIDYSTDNVDPLLAYELLVHSHGNVGCTRVHVVQWKMVEKRKSHHAKKSSAERATVTARKSSDLLTQRATPGANDSDR
jgi:hypothetical protein